MAKHALSKEITKQTKLAIKTFGSYSFNDKGPSEVMDLSDLSKKFKNLSQQEKVQVAKDLKKSSQDTTVLVSLVSADTNLLSRQIDEIVAAGGEELQDHFDDHSTTAVSVPLYSASGIMDLITRIKK